MKIMIETTNDEIAELLALLQANRRIQQITVVEPQRLSASGRVSESGEPECVDSRTGRRGVDTNGFGFIPGAFIDSYGRVEFSRPEDNPLRGWR